MKKLTIKENKGSFYEVKFHPPPLLNKFSSIVFALAAVGVPTLASAAGSVDSLNGFYVTLGPNLQNTKVNKTTTFGDGTKDALQRRALLITTNPWVGGFQPNGNISDDQVDSSESKTSVLPQLSLGYMHLLWGALQRFSLGVEAFYAPKAGSSNIASTTYGASGLLAYNLATHTQVYFKGSYVSMKTNLTGSQQFYNRDRPSFGPAGSNAVYPQGNPSYTDPTFKIDQQVRGVGMALGARQLLPFNVFGGQHLFAGGEVSYTKFASKTIASPYYHGDLIFSINNRFNGSITNTKISAKQYGVNLYVGYLF